MILVFDTETTGKYLFNKGALDPGQPRMVSLAATGFSDDGQHQIAQFYSIVRPDDFIIPDDVAKVHGITHAFAVAHGVDGRGVVKSFVRLFLECRVAIAFNEQFDRHIVLSEIVRRAPDLEPYLDTRKMRCAMLAASSCMKIPNRYGYEGYAWPKLGEAYEWMFKKPMEGAHHAMFDVQATGWLSLAMQKLGYWDIFGNRVLI